MGGKKAETGASAGGVAEYHSRAEGERLSGARCVHCGAMGTGWPIRFGNGGGLSVCAGCGGWADESGRAEAPCRACAFPEGDDLVDHADCRTEEREPFAPTSCASELEELSESVAESVDRTFAPASPDGLTRYVTAISSSLVEGDVSPVRFVDMGEPLATVLPGRQLLVSLGLLASLEDEAQLAFVIAREWELESAGWAYRRYRAAAHTHQGWWKKLTRRAADPLARAVELSLFVGYGAEAEREADKGALAAIVRNDYDAGAALRALRRLESAAIAGRGARYLLAADRAEWLRTGARSLGSSDATRLNREVYRRAVDGFSVFTR